MEVEVGDQEQWKFPKVTLTGRETKLIVATVRRIAVLTLFHPTHTYSFGGRYFLQKSGGPIGLRPTCCIARLVMLWWDEELIKLLVLNNIITNAEARYMDDIRIWLWSIRMGWRWTGKGLEYCGEWREEDRRKGMTPLQKTSEILPGMMNSICGYLTLTMETGDDFQNGRLPTLDRSPWPALRPFRRGVQCQRMEEWPHSTKSW